MLTYSYPVGSYTNGGLCNMEEKIKTIKIQENTHARLVQSGIKDETFDNIINKALDALVK